MTEDNQERKSKGESNNHYRIEELPILSLRITQHDHQIELTSSGFNVSEAKSGMDFLLEKQDKIMRKVNKHRAKPWGVG